jgi:hypothetical protein
MNGDHPATAPVSKTRQTFAAKGDPVVAASTPVPDGLIPH